MTARQLENKIEELQFWVDNNPKHPNYQQQLNLLLHYEFQLNQLKNLTA
ncbi:MAG TPA: hypothetical protein PKC63_15410 [Mariniflexile sp.]|jgi:hypothetical protein|nr:hypothetical protein [Mariniflexile sp.]